MDDREWTPAWTTEQLGDFVDQIKDDRYAALWLLVATTGLEPEVLARLRRDEVDLHERRIFPARRAAARLAAGRGYGLDPTTYDVLRDHVIDWDKQRETSFPEARRLFLRTDGRPVRPEHVSSMFAVHCLRAGSAGRGHGAGPRDLRAERPRVRHPVARPERPDRTGRRGAAVLDAAAAW